MKRGFSYRLGLVLVVTLAALVGIAAVVLTGDEGAARPPLAQGVLGGTFHPVAGSFEPDATELADCGADFRCLEQAFGNIAYRQGPKAALALFERRLAMDESVAADCHPIAHWIGSASLARNNGNVARTFGQGSPSCAAGYYHGILERAFTGVASKSQLAKVAPSLCRGQGLRRYGFLDRQCQHGLGHGLMIQTGYDLPTALSVCRALPTRWDDLTCSNGVFMENSNTSLGLRSRWLDDADPLFPCKEVGPLERRHCYARVPTQALRVAGGDYKKVVAACSSLAKRWARHCFRGMGRDAVELQDIPGKIYERCGLAAGFEGECLFGAARLVIDRAGREGTRGAVALCNGASRAFRRECFRGIGGLVGLLNATNSSRERACARLTRRYADACTSAAIAEVDPRAPEVAWG